MYHDIWTFIVANGGRLKTKGKLSVNARLQALATPRSSHC